MAEYVVIDKEQLETDLTEIADSIRETSRTAESLTFPEGFKSTVDNIITGNKFWDIYQNNGERTNYKYAFCGDGWTDETFNPKYDLILNDSQYVFRLSGIVDFDGCLKRNNVKIKLSGNVNALFQSGLFEKLPPLDLSDVTSAVELIRDCKYLSDVVLLNVNDKRAKPQGVYGSFFGYCFVGCTSLINITITGIISSALVIGLPQLSTQSAKNIILCLYDWSQTRYAFDANAILTLHNDVWNALDSEGATAPNGVTWKEYVASKGWNI